MNKIKKLRRILTGLSLGRHLLRFIQGRSLILFTGSKEGEHRSFVTISDASQSDIGNLIGGLIMEHPEIIPGLLPIMADAMMSEQFKDEIIKP